ncbi:hypothetical protein [[Mycobacterium] nativiensis]|uniref:Uncharacterized protein n=1 Tax=[Mycobacterium] nativiensis TaxID=2855503 RepID=A0ABU5XT78_9MYCO|nr:hypothetical protein [Mycolicibacter sp. MYC340]MEB3031135.1 hypothetical protein [Mycolicibacter sp. MYC340]
MITIQRRHTTVAVGDLANFGGGWENEWIDNPAVGASDLMITPFGDFPLFGSFF